MKKTTALFVILCFMLPAWVVAQDAQDYNSSRSNKAWGEMHIRDTETSKERISQPENCRLENSDCDDTNPDIRPSRWTPDYLDLDSDNDSIPDSIERVNIRQTQAERERERIQNERIQIRDDNSLYCWGRAWIQCWAEVRQERREILKERLQIQRMQYQRLQRQFQPRVQRAFERLSEEEYDKLSERLAGLLEQHQDSWNARLLAAILALQEILESIERP